MTFALHTAAVAVKYTTPEKLVDELGGNRRHGRSPQATAIAAAKPINDNGPERWADELGGNRRRRRAAQAAREPHMQLASAGPLHGDGVDFWYFR